jgi:hypothetical protein
VRCEGGIGEVLKGVRGIEDSGWRVPDRPGRIRRRKLVMAAQKVLIDATGRRRSPATIPGHLAGRAPRNKGMQYPPDPPRPEEIIRVMRQAGHDRHGLRVRALIAVLLREGVAVNIIQRQLVGYAGDRTAIPKPDHPHGSSIMCW